MTKYTCKSERTMFSAWVRSETIVDPTEYLLYDNEEELRDALWEDLYDSCDIGDVEYGDSDYTVTIPDELIQEWRKLKGYE